MYVRTTIFIPTLENNYDGNQGGFHRSKSPCRRLFNPNELRRFYLQVGCGKINSLDNSMIRRSNASHTKVSDTCQVQPKIPYPPPPKEK